MTPFPQVTPSLEPPLVPFESTESTPQIFMMYPLDKDLTYSINLL
jgi:hypothetical protein